MTAATARPRRSRFDAFRVGQGCTPLDRKAGQLPRHEWNMAQRPLTTGMRQHSGSRTTHHELEVLPPLPASCHQFLVLEPLAFHAVRRQHHSVDGVLAPQIVAFRKFIDIPANMFDAHHMVRALVTAFQHSCETVYGLSPLLHINAVEKTCRNPCLTGRELKTMRVRVS